MPFKKVEHMGVWTSIMITVKKNALETIINIL